MYHNVTAHFNAYFLAKEKINEAETDFANSYREDFSRVLPVYLPIDSATVDKNQETLEEARELAAKAIDWHKISNWVDDSYYLIGLIDYYEGNTDDAINTFKYLNVNSKDNEVRHKSLVQLLRIFIDQRKFDEAVYVIDFLSKEPEINKENKKLLYKTLAYYYEVRNEKNGMITALEKMMEYSSDAKEKSRTYFILAQLYQNEGFDALAHSYYQNALAGNPPYERAFFAQLYAQQVAELEKSKDLKKVRAYYDELYDNRKNIDLRNVVLYEKALFELKQEETDKAIHLLHRAAKENSKNEKQKGYIYKKLADIYFSDREDYRSSKYYLDSALQFFTASDPLFKFLEEEKEVLDKYTYNFEFIKEKDSLLLLSKLPPEEQNIIVENHLKEEEKRLLAEAEKKTKKKNPSIFDNLLALGDNNSNSSFYFDNPTAVQQGEIDFFRNWGNRPLTDNWRRKASGFQDRSGFSKENQTTAVEDEGDDINQVISSLPSKESLLSNIPKSEAEIKKLNKELESSYLELGKVLFFDLNKPILGKEYLQELIQRYPQSDKKPETYYTLFLIEEAIGGAPEYYASRLNSEYPDSPFTKSVNNPIDKTSGTIANKNAAENYSKAYSLYHQNEFGLSRQLIRSTLDTYPLTAVTEKLLLLDIMISGKTEDAKVYQKRLEQYINSTKNAELTNMARNMLSVLTGETGQKNLADISPLSSTDTLATAAPTNTQTIETDSLANKKVYKLNHEQTHIFILVVNPDHIEKSKNLTADLENFHSDNFPNSRLRTGNLNFTREESILLVSPFTNAEKASEYRNRFLKEFRSQALPEEIKKSSFVISLENFQQLNKRKDIPEYEAFYKASY
ncbi:hypothetical protein GCM10028791_00560 [Echinicola sediminis]